MVFAINKMAVDNIQSNPLPTEYQVENIHDFC
jgi:hypothetical protein